MSPRRTRSSRPDRLVDDDGRLLGERDLRRCPVCGYVGFEDPPWQDESASLEICPSCGIQFGYDDAAGGDLRARMVVHRQWRDEWIAEGSPWRGTGGPPAGWDPGAQLEAATADEGNLDA